jgi:DNA-binding CsgD family transcriptional regulator
LPVLTLNNTLLSDQAYRGGKEVLTITQINYIRELYYLKGKTYSEISKMTEKNYRTVKKYIEMDDFNEQHHKAKRPNKSDALRPIIRKWLLEDQARHHKQRHTAKRIFDRLKEDNVLNREIIAQPATKIAKLAGVEVPEDTVLIMVEENGGFGVKFPLTGEKLSPVSGVRKAKDFDDAVEKLEKTLEYQGLGHSCGIHTTIQERVDAMANRLKVTKIVNNMAQSLVNSGAWTCGYPERIRLAPQVPFCLRV